MAYAEATSVPVDRSKSEIERTLDRYGATHFAYMITPEDAVIGFRCNGWMVKFTLPMPDAEKFGKTPTGRSRKASAKSEAYNQEIRRRWRALALAIKAKLEVVESGIGEFETEFLANIVMPDGRLVGEHVIPALSEAYKERKALPLLPAM